MADVQRRPISHGRDEVLDLPLVRGLVHLIMGADLLGDLSPTALATFGMPHPMLRVLAWALLIAIGTGILAGEVDPRQRHDGLGGPCSPLANPG